MSEIFTTLLERANEKEFIDYLKTLDPAGKKLLVPHLKKTSKEYQQFGELPKKGTGWGYLKGSDHQRHLIQLASFVLFNLTDYEKSPFAIWILDKKNLDKVIDWYVPEWFSQYVNNLTRNDWIPVYFDYEQAMDLTEKGILKPSNELLARLLPLIINVYGNKKTEYSYKNILKRPVTLEEHLWYLFEFETNIPAIGPYGGTGKEKPEEKTGWLQALRQYTTEGKINRQRILKESLLASNKNFNKNLSGWFAHLFSILEPTKEELLNLQKEIFSTLSSKHSKPVNIALDGIKQIITEPSFDASAFMDAAPLLIASPTKAVVNSALMILEKILKKQPSLAPAIGTLACGAFLHQDDSLQTRAAKLIKVCHKQSGVDISNELIPYQASIMVEAKKIVEEFLAPSAVSDLEMPPDEVIGEEISYKQMAPIPAIESIDDLVFLASQAFDNNQPWHISVLPALLIQWQEAIRAENIAKFEPALQRAIKMSKTGINSQQGLLDHMLGTFFIDVCIHWVRAFPAAAKVLNDLFETFNTKDGNIVKKFTAIEDNSCYLEIWESHYKQSFYTPHRLLLITALNKIKKNDLAPLLSTPTHEPGWIDPLELTKRIIFYGEKNVIPDIIDLQIAVSRCYLQNTEKAIELVKERLTGEFHNLLLFLFDVHKTPIKPFSFTSAWLAASLSKKQKLKYPEFTEYNFYSRPTSYYTGQRKWDVADEDNVTTQYDHREQRQVKVTQRHKIIKTWVEREEPVEKTNVLQKLFSRFNAPKNVASIPTIYDDLAVKIKWVWTEHNDIQRILLLIPNNPEPLLADTINQCLKYSTFHSEGDKKFTIAILQILYEIWNGYGEIANVFLATCMLSSDKTITNLAGEIWINGVSAGNIDSAAIGEAIGRHERIEFAPLKRFTDLALQKLFRISAKHNLALLTMVENIIKQLSLQPITNLKKLLDVYYELLGLNKTAITDQSIIEKLQVWQKTVSVQKVIVAIIALSEQKA